MNSPRSVSQDIEQRAQASVRLHPLYHEASVWPYCAYDIFQSPKEHVDRMNLSVEDKRRIHSALGDERTVILVGYWTAQNKPEPLSGGGKHYIFIVHPQSFAVLHTGIGTWRA